MKYLVLSILLVAMFPASIAAKDDSVNQFVAQHLNSIGTDQARAAIKNRVVQGGATFTVLNVGPTTWTGPGTFVSEGDQLASLFKFPATVYRTEWFISNGKKTLIGQIKPGVWSQFGSFVRTYNEILTEGLWGGTLSTAWALQHLDEHRPKLDDKGVKNVDGRQLHRVDYFPRKGSDLDIQLFFDPDTNRHVMTTYFIRIAARSGPSVSNSGREQEQHYKLVERFDDFKTFDNVSVPTKWTIQFTYGGPSAATIDQFELTADKVMQNISVDPKNFDVK